MRVRSDAPVGCKRMLKDIRKAARKYQIKIKFTKRDRFFPNSAESCTGYFSEDTRTLAVARFNNLETFIPVLAHESCHMDQWIENEFLWEKCSVGHTIFFKWLAEEIEVKPAILEECVYDIIRLEFDCEKRTIAKLKKYRIPTDFDFYIRCMNIYLYLHLFSIEKREWMPEFVECEEIHAAASPHISSSYKKIPVRLRRAFEKKYKELKKAD